MCGRYLIEDGEEVVDMRKIFDKLELYYSNTEEYIKVKKGEIFPTDTVPVIIPEHDTKLDVLPMQWGFRPVKHGGRALINARSETAFEKPTFREPMINKRCIIPANGFFEWQTDPSGKKQKYLIKPAASPLLYFAGIYDRKPDLSAKKDLVHFVILTQDSYGPIRSIHHRMPVAIAKRDVLKWLNGRENDVRELFAASSFTEYKFSQAF